MKKMLNGSVPASWPLKTVVVASQNPVKIQAVLRGFQRMFTGQEFAVQSISVPSGVSRQPLTNAETLQGAVNRAGGAQSQLPQADFWAGVEGGVEETGDGEMLAFAWVAVRDTRHMGCGRTGAFGLPPRIAALIRQGKELGEADDLVFGRTNSKQENGAVGLLTGDVIDRAQFYEQAVVLALIPFKNPGLYPSDL
jgi:inosine/xanthosine triphosphatase